LAGKRRPSTLGTLRSLELGSTIDGQRRTTLHDWHLGPDRSPTCTSAFSESHGAIPASGWQRRSGGLDALDFRDSRRASRPIRRLNTKKLLLGKSCVASRRTCRPRRLFDSARFSPSELLRARNTADSDEPRLLLPPVKSPRDDGRLPNVFVCQRLHRCLETKQSPCSLGLRCAATSMTPTDQRGDRTSAFSESVSCPRTIAFIRIRAGGCKASGRSPRTTSTEPRCPSSTP